jgi:molybdate transport system substrate-binding protein
MKTSVFAATAAALLCGCGGGEPPPAGPRDLRVAAASSLTDLMTQTVPAFQASRQEVRVQLSFGASSTLARQISEGARVDVFLSADAASVDRAGSRVDSSTRVVFLRNRLAMLAPRGKPADPAAIPDGAKIAVAGPEVPAGRVWRDYLRGKGLLEKLENRFANADNVRAALTMFDAQAADYALVYATEAKAAQRRHETWAPEDGPAIEYVAAAVGTPTEEAKAFLAWLRTAGIGAVGKTLGFEPHAPK